jgi:hypothetical protein
MKIRLFTGLVLLGLAVAPLSLFAQVAEVNPYVGYIWPGSFGGGIGDFTGNQLLGVRAGFYVTRSIEVGGDFNFNNHFQPSSDNTAARFAGNLGFPQGSVRTFLWEGEFTYHFGPHLMFDHSVKPYAVFGAGTTNASITTMDSFVLNVRPVVSPTGTTTFVPNDVLRSGDNFFTLSYGGGLKAMRLWGPMGAFGDFRLRTITNFFSNANTWPELSVGLNFAWGEK